MRCWRYQACASRQRPVLKSLLLKHSWLIGCSWSRAPTMSWRARRCWGNSRMRVLNLPLKAPSAIEVLGTASHRRQCHPPKKYEMYPTRPLTQVCRVACEARPMTVLQSLLTISIMFLDACAERQAPLVLQSPMIISTACLV